MTSKARRPVVRLRPNKGGRFFAGSPWVYADELALDRRAKALEPGSIVELEDSARMPLGVFAFNANSRIACRLLDRDVTAEIDRSWIAERLGAARALRDRLFEQPFYRLAHAEADGLPGLIIDRFGDALAVQPNAAWIETRRTTLLAALDQVLDPAHIVWNGGSRARRKEGLPEIVRLMKGAVEAPIETPMNGATFMADLLGGQKTGLYFDQRPNHRFVADLAKGARVLDVFSHVGGFSLAALVAGAKHALAIDSSARALELAEQGAAKSGVADSFETRRGDATDMMRALAAEGATFDVVVCDPPAFAPNKSALEAGVRAYQRVARLGAALTAPGGIFMMCSCSHAVAAPALQELVGGVLRKLGRDARLLRRGGAGPDHPAHPILAETEYLKTLCYALS